MQKPSGYDEASSQIGFIPVALGGHTAQIKQVTETTSSTGKPMVVVLFDFVAPDQQAGYFTSQYKSDTREEKKWPFSGTRYIMVEDYADSSKTSRNFKNFITAVEESNGYEVKWGGANWAVQFKGKKIGVVYGEEEHEYDGKTSMRPVVKYFCDAKKAKDEKAPAPKYLKKKAASSTSTVQHGDDFMNIPDDADEEIPF